MPLHLILKLAAAFPLLLLPSSVRAQPAWPDCPTNFPGAVPPRMVAPHLPGDVTDLCYDGFAVTFSRSKSGPLSSSHFLSRGRMGTARGVTQTTMMHAETRVPANQRAEMSDYAQSGYAVGQLSPTIDMPDAAAKAGSQTLANAVPLTPALNRGLWSAIETITHGLAAKDDVIYVVSGPVFQGGAAQPSAGRLVIPAGIYKAIYNPEQNWAGAYVCENTNNPTCRIVTIAELQAMTGIDVFPALSDKVKSTAAPLPPPA